MDRLSKQDGFLANPNPQKIYVDVKFKKKLLPKPINKKNEEKPRSQARACGKREDPARGELRPVMHLLSMAALQIIIDMNLLAL